LENFRGEWAQTSRWPESGIATENRRVAVVGTGSSGVQTISAVANKAAHLYVFQRTANYVVPAQNKQLDEERFAAIAGAVPAARTKLFQGRSGITPALDPPKPAAHYLPEEQQARLELQWQAGGQGMNGVFADQAVDASVNEIVANFVRDKVRGIVKDQALAEKLCATSYPIGSRRLIMDDHYYEQFNRENVTLVDTSSEPIVEIVASGIRTRTGIYEVDTIVLALGFNAFTGAINLANIRNEKGEGVTDHWGEGPRTLLGLMTTGFPNLFILTGPGSPSVLANMFLMNEYHVDWVDDCIAFMNANGWDTIEPDANAQARWCETVAEASSRLLRLRTDNYMVHVNSDGGRVFMPYTGGLDAYVAHADRVAATGYEGFQLSRRSALRSLPVRNAPQTRVDDAERER
jgi:cation diffusion facilitator CzcD-associated flavoprotein CzcO